MASSDVPHVHNLADFSIEQIEAMCKEFLLMRFRHAIVDILMAPDVSKYYAVNSELSALRVREPVWACCDRLRTFIKRIAYSLELHFIRCRRFSFSWRAIRGVRDDQIRDVSAAVACARRSHNVASGVHVSGHQLGAATRATRVDRTRAS